MSTPLSPHHEVTGAPTGIPSLKDARILLTRAMSHDRLAQELRSHGADVQAVAVTRTLPRPDTEIRAFLHKCAQAQWDWLVLTSPRTVHVLHDCHPDLFTRAIHQAYTRGLRVAAVGQRTAQAWSQATEHHPDVVGTHGAAGLIAHINTYVREQAETPGGILAVPGSALAHSTLANEAQQTGWDVHQYPVYTTVNADELDPQVVNALVSGHIQAIVVTAGSAMRALVDLTLAHLCTTSQHHLTPAHTPVPIMTLGPQSAADCQHILHAALTSQPSTLPNSPTCPEGLHLLRRMVVTPPAASPSPHDLCTAVARALQSTPHPLPAHGDHQGA